MATIQQEIMSIAEAQGYEGKSSGTIAEAINALGSVMGGGGSGGSGAEPFVVTFTNDGPTYTADKTYTEIIEAANAGKVVVGAYVHTNPSGLLLDYNSLVMSFSKADSGINKVVFSCLYMYTTTSSSTPTVNINSYELLEDNTVNVLRRNMS